jgi:hypothetical protein
MPEPELTIYTADLTIPNIYQPRVGGGNRAAAGEKKRGSTTKEA